jgi:hypothetical protein
MGRYKVFARETRTRLFERTERGLVEGLAKKARRSVENPNQLRTAGAFRAPAIR